MDALRGVRVLVSGDDPVAVEAARSGLAAEGALAEVCRTDPNAVAAAAATGAPPPAFWMCSRVRRARPASVGDAAADGIVT